MHHVVDMYVVKSFIQMTTEEISLNLHITAYPKRNTYMDLCIIISN